MAQSCKRLTHCAKVIDVTVENHSNRTVFVEYRLMAAGHVDDAEAAHSESERATFQVTLIVGTTVRHRRRHATHQRRGIHRSAKINRSANATHYFLIFLCV